MPTNHDIARYCKETVQENGQLQPCRRKRFCKIASSRMIMMLWEVSDFCFRTTKTAWWACCRSAHGLNGRWRDSAKKYAEKMVRVSACPETIWDSLLDGVSFTKVLHCAKFILSLADCYYKMHERKANHPHKWKGINKIPWTMMSSWERLCIARIWECSWFVKANSEADIEELCLREVTPLHLGVNFKPHSQRLPGVLANPASWITRSGRKDWIYYWSC